MLRSSYRYLIPSFFGYLFLPVLVAKITNCDEGHLCSSNRECCSQGCCPTQPRAATDHVLNLFFINHWYFWCVVVAVLLAILCAYSLWKKRRQFCGWSASDHHTQSEGDSAGSCYAPPQYSRCSSFHHPPPPYTEVTSKPDLYPLVFTCNSDNGKNGASYLMVQYFRNYIVRPAGSISATSTVDSLSSSFICNVNEANTLVPPPYSRAASPDVAVNAQFQQHFMIPRSASQLIYTSDNVHLNRNSGSNINTNENVNNTPNGNNVNYQTHLSSTQSKSRANEIRNVPLNSNLNENSQQFRNIMNSNTSLSDIFVNSTFNEHSNNNMIQNNLIEQENATNLNYSNNTNSTNQFPKSNNSHVYNSCGSIGGISITVPVAPDGESEYRDLDVLRRSLETCCQILQKQQLPSSSFTSSVCSPVNVDLVKKYDNGIPSYLTSTTCSAVSSLAHIGSPSSPPQATSPTGEEVRDVLERIRQLEIDDDSFDVVEMQQTHLTPTKRPLAFPNKNKYFSKPNKAMYIPICNPNSKSIRSPISGHNIFRGRKSWISRSAPTTPGTSLPPTRIEDIDHSPLLNEHDEENE